MRKGWIRLAAMMAFGVTLPALGDVCPSEFVSEPVSEGWGIAAQYCDPETWNEDGWYHQELDSDACPPGPEGGADVYRRSLEPFNGAPEFFVEFRVQTDGDRSMIPYGAPALLAMGNFSGVNYHLTIARDLIQFYRAAHLPIWFIEIAPDVPHTYRVELDPERYAFYIDGDLIDEGPPEGPFPADRSSISWRGRSYYLPCHNAWDYIRYGVLPQHASGDYDSDGALTLFDHYFVADCLTKDGPGIFGGPGQNAGPGCRFADFDGNASVDLLDFAEFQNLFSESHP